MDIGPKFVGYLVQEPSSIVQTTRSELLHLYGQMQLMRRMEISLDLLYKNKLIRGFCHLYDGQEAVAAGLGAAASKTDSVVTSYRDHCIHLIRGGTAQEVISELLGKASGASRGLGGSMHMYKRDWNYFGGHGIVGAQARKALPSPG